MVLIRGLVVGVVAVVMAGCAADDGFVDAQTIAASAAEAAERIVFPSGESYKPEEWPDDAVFGATLGIQSVENQAMCAWLEHWLEARRVGDVAAQETAQARLEEWPSTTFYRTADASVHRSIDRILDDIRDGIPTTAAQQVEVNC